MSTHNVFHLIVGRMATDATFRDRFFTDIETVLAEHDLDPVQRATLHHMSECPVTRLGTAMVNKAHSKHEAKARKEAVLV